MSSLRQQTVSGLKWMSLAQFSRLAAQIFGTFVLAHILSPSDFGLIAMASVFIGIANLFRDFGTAAAIIQKQEPSPQLLDSVFWLNIAIGLGLALLGSLCVPLVALWFGSPSLNNVLLILLLSFPITSLGIVQQALLEKKSHFRSIALIESFSAFIGLAAATLLAFAGWGVFSLVAQTLVMSALNTIGFWSCAKWKPKLRVDISEIQKIFSFSGSLVGFNVVNYFIRNADNLLIGRYLGATDLGYYSMAYRLMLWPLQNISNVIGRVLFPSFSQLQQDKKGLAEGYIYSTAAITLLAAPLMLGFFVLRESFVHIALGTQWRAVVGILMWLIPVGLLQAIGTTVGTLYLATGRTDILFKWGIAASFIVIPAIVVGLQWGLTGVAAGYCMASFVLFWPSLMIALRLVGLKVNHLIIKIMPTVIAAVLMALLVSILNSLIRFGPEYEWLRLILLVGVGVIAYIALIWITQKSFFREIVRAVANR
ncbi:MOP flippase family protein [Janthinobacterium sp. 17J80-10]|uniref:MOP flippase family protein n=1 Tax=Janthinobacterium sp. 17J80-10 TaxID=2497863 RepID=UPI0010059B4E|nr:MOP flippase family protein [Janthinobacterium sp. 17J80-10]QAU33631.1 colanic acid exporter [Janthinobacterium sp. 17J80-10]